MLERALAVDLGVVDDEQRPARGHERGEPLDRLFGRMAKAKGIDPGAVEAEIVAATALRRIADPGDIAEAVRYLASPRAKAVTGVSIDVNGGQWLP